MLANLWRRGRGVHVAEQVLDPPERDAAALVTDLQTGGRREKDMRTLSRFKGCQQTLGLKSNMRR